MIDTATATLAVLVLIAHSLVTIGFIRKGEPGEKGRRVA